MKKTILAGLLLLASLSIVSADTITESAAIPATGNAADLTYELPQFNSADGTLTGVTLTLDYNQGGTVTAFNLDSGTPGTFQGEGSLGFVLSSPGASVTVTADTGLLSGSYDTAPLSETVLTSPGISGLTSSAGVDSSDLLSYVGGGNVDVTFTSDAGYYTYNASSTAPAGTFVGVSGTASLNGVAQVTYTYTAAPEPGAWALMLAGCLVLFGFTRRARLI